MQKFAATATLFVMVITIGGCATLEKPDLPLIIEPDKSPNIYADTVQFKSDIAKYVEFQNNQDTSKARGIRDNIINKIRFEIDINYHEYESKFFNTKATFNTISDGSEFMISALATLSTVESTKNILTTLLTGFKGTRISYDNNFFREKTVEIIISKMQANRARSNNRIMQKMRKFSTADYPLSEALVDLVQLFYAGTLQAAIQSLSDDAGKDADDAKKETRAIENTRLGIPAGTQLDSLDRIRIKTDAMSPDEAQLILHKLNITVSNGEDPRQLLRNEVKKILDDPNQLRKIWDAIMP